MIIVAHGNLLTAEAEALVNTVNTVGVMGKGIALQFKRAYPANYAAYRAACATNDVRLGQVFVFDTGLMGLRRYVLNFPTKAHWRSSSRLTDIRAGLTDLARVVGERRIGSVAIPALGCGNGGLDWNEVRPLIEQAFADLSEVRVLLFPPEGAPNPADMPVATERPPLTSGRAALLAAIDRYLGRAQALEPRDGVTILEIQKIAYFLQALGQPLRLNFVPARYGPYAENLNRVLDRLEGHYLVGFGDRSARVEELQPIQLTAGTSKAVTSWLEANNCDSGQLLDQLAALVEGFETPYSLELLATVHYAAHFPSATTDIGELTGRVQSWSGRKARLFTPTHIGLAYKRLQSVGLLVSTADV